MKFRLVAVLLAVISSVVVHAKETPFTIDWPDKNPTIRFTVLKFHNVGSNGSEKSYIVDVSALNLTNHKIQEAAPQFYLFDKKNVRIGDGYIHLTNLGPGETVKFTISAFCSGSPETMTLSSGDIRKVSVTVYSVPPGAELSVDGTAAGVTPVALNLPPGSHRLEFTKEGFNKGTFPFVVSPNQISGGSVTFELGTSAHDTVELRDGTVLTGDVEEVNGTQVVVRVGGDLQNLDRNQVKRILLVQRDAQR